MASSRYLQFGLLFGACAGAGYVAPGVLQILQNESAFNLIAQSPTHPGRLYSGF
jgi:hypothetical protein